MRAPVNCPNPLKLDFSNVFLLTFPQYPPPLRQQQATPTNCTHLYLIMSDPLVALRTTIASNLTPELLSKDGEVLPDADLSKAASLRLPANGDREAQTFPLTELTKYESKIPNKMQLDLRVVYNCWLTRDLNVTDYIQISDERGIFNLKFVERADLLGWLKGENEESENILNDKAGKADGSGDGNAANQATDESKPTKKTVSFDDSSSAELKLIYEHERNLQNHNSVLRGSKLIDFSTVSKECQKSIIQAFKTKQSSSARNKKPEPHGAVSKSSSNGSQKGKSYFPFKFCVFLCFFFLMVLTLFFRQGPYYSVVTVSLSITQHYQC